MIYAFRTRKGARKSLSGTSDEEIPTSQKSVAKTPSAAACGADRRTSSIGTRSRCTEASASAA